MGPEYFPSLLFFFRGGGPGGLFLNCGSQREPTHVCVYTDPPPLRLIAMGSGG